LSVLISSIRVLIIGMSILIPSRSIKCTDIEHRRNTQTHRNKATERAPRRRVYTNTIATRIIIIIIIILHRKDAT
tara:strand:+ start:1300 stop:1524 length:225 start_codon:yes stop_codon:yes gene_type:complete